LAHTGACATREVVALSRHAQQAGADGLMVVGPYYEPINEAEIYAHFVTVAGAVDLPVMVYNHPGATSYSMSPEFIACLGREIENIKLVKDTTGDVGRIHHLMELCGDTITVFSGADTLAFAGFAAGTVGAVWGAANATPRQCADLFEAIGEQNDLVRGRAIWRTFYPINWFFEQEGYVAAVKAATNMQGIDIGEPRPPILPLPDHKKAELGQRLKAAGLHGAAAPAGAH
jgi:4-hydroxy-tetrahydrodipicolinate synthase